MQVFDYILVRYKWTKLNWNIILQANLFVISAVKHSVMHHDGVTVSPAVIGVSKRGLITS